MNKLELTEFSLEELTVIASAVSRDLDRIVDLMGVNLCRAHESVLKKIKEHCQRKDDL